MEYVAGFPASSPSRLAAASLEIGADGWCIVHFPAVPGAGFAAPGVDEAVEVAAASLDAETKWLAVRGLTPLALQEPWGAGFLGPVPGGKRTRVTGKGTGGRLATLETARTGAIAASGDSEAYFSWCGQPLTPDLVAQASGHLKAGREDLLAMIADRGPGWLDTRPGPGRRSPRETLHQLADEELFYLVRLSRSGTEAREMWAAWSGRGEPELERISGIRQRLYDTLAGLAGSERACVTVHEPHAERWTPLKVAYRAIWHERYIARHLQGPV